MVCVGSVRVKGLSILPVGCVRAPHVAGLGCARLCSSNLVLYSRVYADELAFFGKEVGRVWMWADAIETLSSRCHLGGAIATPSWVPCGNARPGGRGAGPVGAG